MVKTWKCIFCDKPTTGHGNNPAPLRQISEGKCCKTCLQTQVIPARMALGYTYKTGL